jgi:hypothetical protein
MLHNIIRLAAVAFIVGLMIPAPARAETLWIAWERTGMEGQPSAWTIVDTVDPFSSQGDCQATGRKVVKAVADLRKERGHGPNDR